MLEPVIYETQIKCCHHTWTKRKQFSWDSVYSTWRSLTSDILKISENITFTK